MLLEKPESVVVGAFACILFAGIWGLEFSSEVTNQKLFKPTDRSVPPIRISRSFSPDVRWLRLLRRNRHQSGQLTILQKNTNK